MKTFITILITVFITSVICFAAWMALKAKGKLNKEKPTVVRIEKPVKGELIEFINAPGQVEPIKKVSIRARISAQIVALPFEEGDRVTRGNPDAGLQVPASVLLRLDDNDLKAELRSAKARYAAQEGQIEVARTDIETRRATIEGVKITLAQAERELNRQKELFISKDISQDTVEKAQSRVDELKTQLSAAENGLKNAKLSVLISQHNLEAAQANISRAEDSLSYTTITSPIDGVVTRVNAEAGEMATGSTYNPGPVIVEVADLSKMLVMAQVDEADVASVKEGQNAKVHIHAWPDKVFQGVVDSVALSHKIDRNGSKYFEAEIILETLEERVLSGLTADVDIEIKEYKDISKVPSQAVLGRPVDELPMDIRENCPEVDRKKTLATVVYRYVKAKEDRYKTLVTPVRTGASDATHTIITSGINEQDMIVVGPYKVLESIKHDQKVRDEKEVEKEKKEKEKEKEKEKKKVKTKEQKEDKSKQRMGRNKKRKVGK